MVSEVHRGSSDDDAYLLLCCFGFVLGIQGAKKFGAWARVSDRDSAAYGGSGAPPVQRMMARGPAIWQIAARKVNLSHRPDQVPLLPDRPDLGAPNNTHTHTQHRITCMQHQQNHPLDTARMHAERGSHIGQRVRSEVAGAGDRY